LHGENDCTLCKSIRVRCRRVPRGSTWSQQDGLRRPLGRTPGARRIAGGDPHLGIRKANGKRVIAVAAAGETAQRFGKKTGADLSLTVEGFTRSAENRRLILTERRPRCRASLRRGPPGSGHQPPADPTPLSLARIRRSVSGLA
jgi:hypothetical protein